jgi:hypothetical protein
VIEIGGELGRQGVEAVASPAGERVEVSGERRGARGRAVQPVGVEAEVRLHRGIVRPSERRRGRTGGIVRDREGRVITEIASI